jgi:hypothetical protein
MATEPLHSPAAHLDPGGCSDGLPVDPLSLPGLIGDTVRWICKGAIIEQPRLALLNTLAFAGAVFGRRYYSELDTRTNVYFVGLAKTGHGKDLSRKMINKLAFVSGLSPFIGANFVRSGAGLAQSILTQASQILMIDEFGMFLQALSDPKAQPYHREISKMFMTLYSDSSGVYNHGVLADPKAEPIVLNQPCLSIYGTSTIEKYAASLRREAIESGSLNRFIVLDGKQIAVVKRDIDRSIPQDLVNEWSYYVPFGGGKMSCKEKPEGQILVRHDETVADEIYNMQVHGLEQSNGVNGALWVRYAENSNKLAMILAIARDHREPVVTLSDLEFGKSLVAESISFTNELAKNYIAENEHEENTLAVLRFIRAGKKTKSELVRKFQGIKKRDRDDIIASLMESGSITKEMIKTGSKPVETFSIPASS